MARAFSLVVAVFVIANTFLINVTQRRKQLGVMRAIGATRGQIAGMVFREALLMGIVGTILGSALGVVSAHFLTQAMGSLYQSALPSIDLTQPPFLIGTWRHINLVPNGAVLRNSRSFRAGHDLWLGSFDPRRGLAIVESEPFISARSDAQRHAGELEGVSKWLVRTGAIVRWLVLCGMGASIAGWIPMFSAVFAAVLMLIGLVLMLPIALDRLSRIRHVDNARRWFRWKVDWQGSSCSVTIRARR